MMKNVMIKCPDAIRKGLREACEDVYRIRFALLILVLYTVCAKALFGEFCPLRIFTGFPCPGCGMMRAAFCVLKFRFLEAFQWNPMVYLWIPALVFLLWKRYYFHGKSIWPELVPVVAGLATLAYYIYQMAVCFPNREPYTYFQGNLLVMVKNAIAFFID
jgi:hypothetical protein